MFIHCLTDLTSVSAEVKAPQEADYDAAADTKSPTVWNLFCMAAAAHESAGICGHCSSTKSAAKNGPTRVSGGVP